MNKIVVSIGLAASGVVGIGMSAGAQSSMLGDVKNWNASASLRGFYDDNYSVGANSNGSARKGSFGIEVAPTITATIPLTQTQIGFLYSYGLQWYQQRDEFNVNPYDQSHTVNVWVDHAFSERWDLKVSDNFNSGQEPGFDAANARRLNGNNISNSGHLTLHTDVTPTFSSELVYANNFYQYSDQSTYAAQLNRIQNSPQLNLQWHLAPETMAFVGYQFQIENYTDNAVIGQYGPGGIHNYYSDSRDNINHYGYVGLQHNFLPNLVGSGRVGVQYHETINDPLKNTSDLSPYADLSLIYTYRPGCNVEVGFTETRNATDVVSVNTLNNSLTQDQLSSTLYASINHHITQKLLVSVIGKWMDSTFNGGQYDGQDQTDYSLGLNANYAFTRHFSAEAGYNYDNVSAPAGTSQAYERNRFYLGISVAY